MEIKSKDIQIVDIETIVPNPKNANRHSIEQLERLQKLIKYQGFRNPLIVSNRTGFLVAGHGRLDAAKSLGIKKVPVIFQDFENEAQEYSYVVSDNEIARWAELDKQSVYDALEEMPEIELENLGIENFSLFDFQQIDEEQKPEVEKTVKYILKVELPNEMEMHDLKDDLIEKGHNVKVVND